LVVGVDEVDVASLLEEVIEAHGGSERWQASAELSVDVSAGGLAVASKFQRSGLRDLVAQVSTDRQRVLFTPYPGPGKRGIFEGGAVRIESDDGRLVRQRLDPRPSLGDARHLLWWDHLDLLYFGASAVWTYLATPLIFATSGFQIEALEPWTERGEVWRRLAVTFPAELHTHSRQQIFYFGDDGLIRRQDYTAEEFGNWAKSANYGSAHRDFNGLIVATHRRVFPRRANNQARPHPELIWIDIRNVSVSS
jgi:hypothetical protein